MKKIYLVLSSLLPIMLVAPYAHSTDNCERIVIDGGLASFTDHVITYQENPLPEWKNIWDQARKFYSQGKYDLARERYEQLLAQKENFDQARWEYVTILICQKQWQKAGIELSVLISNDPGRPEYELARAEIALGSGDFNEAVKIYAPLYEQQCVDIACTKGKARILSGYINALEQLERMDDLGPLLEQLIRLRPDDSGVQKKAVEVALKNEQPQRALFFLHKLAEHVPGKSTIFQQMALVEESLGNTEKAIAHWQEVIGLNPHDMTANKRLIDYYHKLGIRPMELKHVASLLDVMPTDSDLLERAAQLNENMDRPDRALEYYDRLLSVQPKNKDTLQHRQHALEQLAVKLLSLVENSGSSMLWQDLVQVTADRTAVYRAMADRLRGEQGRHSELIEVLLVIYHESPDDSAIYNELTALLKEQGRVDILASVREVDAQPSVSLPR